MVLLGFDRGSIRAVEPRHVYMHGRYVCMYVSRGSGIGRGHQASLIQRWAYEVEGNRLILFFRMLCSVGSM